VQLSSQNGSILSALATVIDARRIPVFIDDCKKHTVDLNAGQEGPPNGLVTPSGSSHDHSPSPTSGGIPARAGFATIGGAVVAAVGLMSML